MQVKEITLDIYKKFIVEQNCYSFQNMKEMLQMRQKQGQELHILGLYNEEEKIVGAGAFFGYKLKLFGKYFDCHYGPLLNYNNLEEVTYFFKQLKVFLKKWGSTYCSFNPDLIINVWDNKCNINTNDENIYLYKDKLNSILSDLQYSKNDDNEDTNGKWNMRYFFIKNLEGLGVEDLIKSYSSQGKRSVKNSLKNHLEIYEITLDDIRDKSYKFEKFQMLMDLSAQKQGYENKSDNYFLKLKENLQDKVKILLVKVDLKVIIDNLNKDIEESKLKIEKLSDNNKQKDDLKRKIKKLLNQIDFYKEYLKNKNDTNVYLSAGVFIKTDKEVIYLFGGNDEKFKEIGSSYYLQNFMMKKTIDYKIKNYNFYGINGKFDGTDNVLKFKQGFNGNIIELIGTYTIINNNYKYNLYQTIKKMLK